MKKIIVVFSLSIITISLNAQTSTLPASKVSFDAFEKVTKEAKKNRQGRLIGLDKFLEMGKEKNVIILDARSSEMYNGKHVKGAINLNFADFTQDNLAAAIPSFDTKILIYCNNNFDGDKKFFDTKAAPFTSAEIKEEPVTLALNIPTYINLYGYGYKNVYELSEFVPVTDNRITFEGTAVE